MITIEKEKCNGCHVCNWVCPHGVLSMNSKIAAIAHNERCIECGACELNCASGAIKVTKGTGCLYVIIKEDILGVKGKACGCRQ
jgi:NAD-dependent dihydropyrimidine dehydrogenase PreA subunit